MQCDKRDDLLNLVKLRYATIEPNVTLKVFGVPQASLKEYHTTPNNKRYGLENLPLDEMRLLDEEIKSTSDYNRDTQASTKTDDDEFVFVNSRGSLKQAMAKDREDSEVMMFDDEKDDGEFRTSTLVMSRKPTQVKLEDFKLVMVLGRGTFGKVYLAELGLNKQLYAIKSIRKDILIDTDQVANTKLEKDILFTCDHPFLVGMDYLF